VIAAAKKRSSDCENSGVHFPLVSGSTGLPPMSGRSFFDTTILVYSISSEEPRAAVAEKLLAGGGWISVQVLNEFAAVARRKLSMSWEQTREALLAIRALCESPIPLSIETHEAGLEIAARYGFSIYDALILAAALEAYCDVLYTEDMQNGRVIGPLTIRNPFLIA
jgi:predicted nucleic acid-binding protein